MTKRILRPDYFYFNRSTHFVVPDTKEERTARIKMLEEKGYTFSLYSYCDRDSCIETILPLAIDTMPKAIEHMGNVTCAAAACSSNVIVNVDTFIAHFLNDGTAERALHP